MTTSTSTHPHTMKKLFSALVASAVVAVPATTEAQVTLGPTVAFHDDHDFGVGAMATLAMPTIEGVGFMGDFTYFFPGADPELADDADFNYWEINGNGTWDIPVEDRPIAPFVLAGLNVARESRTDLVGDDDSNTEIGLNIGGGIRLDTGAFSPILGARAELGGGEGAVLFATLPFRLGD